MYRVEQLKTLKGIGVDISDKCIGQPVPEANELGVCLMDDWINLTGA